MSRVVVCVVVHLAERCTFPFQTTILRRCFLRLLCPIAQSRTKNSQSFRCVEGRKRKCLNCTFLKMSREDLERAVGFEILPNDKSVVSLCERVGGTNGCDELLMSDSQYKTYMVKVIGMCSGFFQENFKVFRRLGWAKNATELEAVMEKAKKKHVVIDEASRDLYEKKKAKFASRV